MLVTLNPAAPRVAEAPARSSPATLGTGTWATPLETMMVTVEPLSAWVLAGRGLGDDLAGLDGVVGLRHDLGS